MTRQKFTLTAALLISLTGCQSSCEYHAGTSSRSSSQSSGSEQPAQPSQSPRRGGRQVTRVTVRNRPPVDQEVRTTPAPAPAPAVVQPTPVAEPAPAPAVQPAPELAPAVQPAPAPEPAAAVQPAPDAGNKPRVRGRIRDRIQAATPATTGQAETPSNTPEPAPSTETPEEILRRRTDKEHAETHTVAPPPPKRLRGLRNRNRDGGSEQPVVKGNSR